MVTEGKFTSGIEGSLEKAGDASGQVTSAETGKPLQGIGVCYYEFTEFLVGCVLTDENGEYKTRPLGNGEYRVLFASPPESGLNYAMQFYGGFASRFDSPYIDIEAGKLMTGIDAEMTSGGSITGDVTDAYSGKGLKGALVCALPGSGEIGSCSVTDASGHYTIAGLDSVKYEVLFEAEGYKWQYYDDVSQPSEARSITVSAGTITEGVDAAMQLIGEPPRNLQPPSISGNAAVGDVLECTGGSWAGRPAPSLTYSWLRNGHTNVGAGNAYRVQQADEGSGLQCEVTAESSAGSASAFSNPVNVPPPSQHGAPPPPPPPPPVRSLVPLMPPASPATSTSISPAPGDQTISGPSVGVAEQPTPTTPIPIPAASIFTSSTVYTYSGRRGGTFVNSGELVRCPAGSLSCQIAVEIVADRSTKKLVLLRVKLSVPAGEPEPLRFKLSADGTALLRDLKRIRATVIVTARRGSTKPVTVSHTIMLKSPA
jgi:Carboxypeptidase regulatory-like domain